MLTLRKFMSRAPVAVVVAAVGILAFWSLVTVEAQDQPGFQVWSDAPNRIIVHWNDEKLGHHRYHEGFKDGEEYVIRWKYTRSGTDRWEFADAKNIGASVGDPDVVIELPDAVPGGSEYDVSLYRTVHSDKQDCMGPAETLDDQSCTFLGTRTITTNLTRTVGGSKPSAWWRGLDGLSQPRRAWAQGTPDGTMYGTDSSSDSLYTVDRSGGSYTLVGSTGTSNPRGLAYDGSTMYGTDGSSGDCYTVNLDTGAFTSRGDTGKGGLTNLEYANSTMYGYHLRSGGGNRYDLATVNLASCAYTNVNGGGLLDVGGLGHDGATMYTMTTSLYTIDLAGGTNSSVGPTGVANPGALAWDGATMYGTSVSADSFYTVNRTAGGLTLVGSTGTSEPRGLAFVPTSNTVPDAPATPTLTAGGRQLQVTWDAPDDGGDAITGYGIQYRQQAAASWTAWPHSGVGRTATITGLANGSTYEVQVRATNGIGNSGWSPTATVALPFPGLPVKPVGFGAQGGEGRIILTWTDPADSSITRYEYKAWAQGTAEPGWAQIPNSGAGTTYYVHSTGGSNAAFNTRLRAVNASGPSLPSEEVAATPAAATSQPPGLASLSAATGDLAGTVVLTWTLNSADDASIDRMYQIRRRPSGGAWTVWTTVPNSWRGALTHTVSGLSSNTLYDFETRASNSVGTSSARAVGNIRTGGSDAPDASPGKINYFAYTQASTTGATLIWDAPTPGSVAIVGYDVRYRQNASPNPEWITTLLASTTAERQITGLLPGTPYEAQVRARNALAAGPWSDTLFFETNSNLFRNAPPYNLEAENIAQSKTRIAVSLDWEAVLDATSYEVRVTSPHSQQIVEAAENRLEIAYELAETDTGGTLMFSVRGKRVSGAETTYTPWAPEVSLFYFVDSTIPVSEVLDAEIAGNREVSQGVMDTRESLDAAITDVSQISGFEPDTRGLMDFLAVLPALLIVGAGTYAGMKFRALGLALGVSSVIAVMSMFVGVAVLGLDVIWPMLGMFGLIAFGILSFIRTYRVSTPVVLYALLFAALHIAAIFAQNMAGFALSGAADYGDSIWSGTPVDDLLAVRKIDSYFDLPGLFATLGDTLFGLYRLAVFDYAAFQGHEGAALWFVAVIKLVLSLATSALTITIIRQLFQTGIFNSAAGLAMVVGGVGAAAVIASVAGDAGGIPQVSITAAQQGATVNEGAPAVFMVSANPAPEQPLLVNITVSQNGGYVESTNLGDKAVTIPPSGSAQFTIPTMDDDANNAAGSVSVAIADPSAQSYQIREPSSATVAVTPILPVVTIAAAAQTVDDDAGPARFTLRTSPALPTDLDVSLSVVETLVGSGTNHVAAPNLGNKTVTIPAGGVTQYNVPLTNGNGTSQLVVTITTGSGYEAGDPSAAIMDVTP